MTERFFPTLIRGDLMFINDHIDPGYEHHRGSTFDYWRVNPANPPEERLFETITGQAFYWNEFDIVG